MMTPSLTFSQAKQKKSNTKTKTKVDVKRKKQKVFLSSPTIIPSSTFSERLLIFVLHRWSMIGMHSQAEAYTLHYSTLSPLCPILSFFIIFFTLRPLFFYTFTLFYSAPYFFLMCALLFYIFALRPTLFTLPPTSCTFYHAFLCVFFYTVPSIYQSYHQSQVAISLNH